MLKIFRKIQTRDADLTKVQSQIEQCVNPALRLPLLSYVQVNNVVIGTADTEIEHLLGRTPLGWFIADNTADSRVWRTAAFNDSIITLRASASTTVSLIVF